MFPALPLTACEIEEDEEKDQLRQVVIEFDELFEQCQLRELTLAETTELDNLYGFLTPLEDDIWGDAPYAIPNTISERLGIDFPALRFQLGMLPDTMIYIH